MAFCDRPHERYVNFESSRFVVHYLRGLVIGDRKFEPGEEIPQGALSLQALQQEYRVRNIELLDFVLGEKDPFPELREACARNGVTLETGKEEPETVPADPPKSQQSHPGKPKKK